MVLESLTLKNTILNNISNSLELFYHQNLEALSTRMSGLTSTTGLIAARGQPVFKPQSKVCICILHSFSTNLFLPFYLYSLVVCM